MGIFSGSEKAKADDAQAWQPGDTCYTWLANGMLESVITPEGKTVTFEYDALGRRTAKTSDGTARMFCWDGNVLLHEWDCRENERPRLVTDDMGRESYDHKVTFENVITWVYDGRNFTPVAKVTEQERYTIVHDYLGTPTQAYDSKGKLVWEMLLDVYGNAKEYSGEKCFIPFCMQGMYAESELDGLYYNRFRWYDSNTGNYLSQDPIGLAGNNPTLYAYVFDINSQVDVFGLAKGDILTEGTVYRAGGNTLNNYTPSLPKDIEGLSTFSSTDVLKQRLPNVKKAQVLDLSKLGSDLIAVDDGGGHISIKPKNDPDKVKITEWGNLKGKEGVPNPLAEQVQQARTDSVKICH